MFGEVWESLSLKKLNNKRIKKYPPRPLFGPIMLRRYLITSYFEPLYLGGPISVLALQPKFTSNLPCLIGENSGRGSKQKASEIFWKFLAENIFRYLMEEKLNSLWRLTKSFNYCWHSSKGRYFLSFQKPIWINLPKRFARVAIDYAACNS